MSQNAPQPSVQCGAVIAGKFKVLRVLGEGGMGVVLLAHHLDLERPVAIKVLRDELAKDEAVVRRMLLEARVAGSLRSEHVARVLDIGRVESGAPYIVMEYLEGCDLGELLSQIGPMPPLSAVSFVLQACEGVAEAHAAGIVHRDLKPENLFLTSRADGMPVIKVLDFGISKNVSRCARTVLTDPSTAVGSPDYMSPEQMSAAHCVDVRSDIWSLGAILYELVTGRTPFAAETVPAVCARVLRDDPVKPSTFCPQIPPGLEWAILRCLDKDPGARFQTVAELAQDLAPFSATDSTDYAARILRVSAGVRPVPTSAVELWRAATGSIHALPRFVRPGIASDAPSVLTPSRGTRRPYGRLYLAAGAIVLLVVPPTLLQLSSLEEAPVEPARGSVTHAVQEVGNLPTATALESTEPPPSVVRSAEAVPRQGVDDAAENPPPRRKAAAKRPGGRRSLAKSFARKNGAIELDLQSPVPPPLARSSDRAVPPPSATAAPRIDAWNTDSFGGRR